MQTTVIKLSPTRFQIGYPGKGTPITADFGPVLDLAQRTFPDSREFVLKHWQARPLHKRRWGIFAWEKGQGTYYSYWPEDIAPCNALHWEIQAEENPVPPTAVLCYPSAVVRLKDKKLVIQNAAT